MLLCNVFVGYLNRNLILFLQHMYLCVGGKGRRGRGHSPEKVVRVCPAGKTSFSCLSLYSTFALDERVERWFIAETDQEFVFYT